MPDMRVSKVPAKWICFCKPATPKQLLSEGIPQRENINLIVLGAAGPNALEGILAGPASKYIVQNAQTDVLAVRTG